MHYGASVITCIGMAVGVELWHAGVVVDAELWFVGAESDWELWLAGLTRGDCILISRAQTKNTLLFTVAADILHNYMEYISIY